MREFVASSDRPRLDEFLAREITQVSVVRLRRMIFEGEVLVNGAPALKGRRLSAGDAVRVQSSLDDPTSATPERIPLEVLYEDDDVIAVNKPPALLTHPSRTSKSGTLANALTYHFLVTTGRSIRPGLVHRLDRDTSGVIVVAKNLRAHRILARAFREKRVRKRYLALLTGVVRFDEGEIDAPIACDRLAWPHWRVRSDGRPAVTRYTVTRRFQGHTLVTLSPQTGRTHQLRIHTALLGHPIVGDSVYARTIDPITLRHGIRHHLLHAHQIAFIHPTLGCEMPIEAPLPRFWSDLLSRLQEV